MTCSMICNAIKQFGTECVISEYNSNTACVVRGIIQPIKNLARENNVLEHTALGLVDNSSYNFFFNLPDKDINFDNAIVYAYNSHFWLKGYKIFYFKDKPLYAQATLLPYEKE